MLDDVYNLAPHSSRYRLVIGSTSSATEFVLEAESETGNRGHLVFLDSALTFMCPDGRTLEVLVFVEVDPATMAIANSYFLPLSFIDPGRDYALVDINHETAADRLNEMVCISFVRGTRITLANGLQKPIEELLVGDQVLTHENGPCRIQWVGQKTERATGNSAPILIAKGALNNTRDLMVSPNDRLFVYQRQSPNTAAGTKTMVRAENLVNGDSIVRNVGGFYEYCQFLLEDHQVVYAEGIATDSLVFDTRVRHAIPAEGQAGANADHGGSNEVSENETTGALIGLHRKSAG